MSSPKPPLPPLKDDGLPTLPTGEPVLARWFVLVMIALAIAAIVVTVWAISAIPRGEPVSAAERRPPGDALVTIDRGDAQLGESTETEAGPGCMEPIELIGDSGTRAAGRNALAATCELLGRVDFPQARAGLNEWIRGDGQLRFAAFELAGVESSTRVEDERIALELNARFLFEDAGRAAPTVLHQLMLIGSETWPGEGISAATELAAAQAHLEGCSQMNFQREAPRGCRDVEELLAQDDPLAALVEAGFSTE